MASKFELNRIRANLLKGSKGCPCKLCEARLDAQAKDTLSPKRKTTHEVFTSGAAKTSFKRKRSWV